MTHAVILTTKGEEILVDASDYEHLSAFNWRMAGAGYASRSHQGRTLYMHRDIAQPAKGLEVDHIDGDKTNNRRSNLRVCTRQENLRNRPRNKNNTTGFAGVSKHRGRYRAMIKDDRRSIFLGSWETAAEAGAAYQVKAAELFGDFHHKPSLLGQSD